MTLFDLDSQGFLRPIFVLHVLILLADLIVRLFKKVDLMIKVFELVFGQALLEIFDDLIHIHSINFIRQELHSTKF